MAKAQKNMKLPPAVLDWLEEEETSTGISQPRIILVALLWYAVVTCTDLPVWTRLATLLDKGKIDFTEARAAILGSDRPPSMERLSADTKKSVDDLGHGRPTRTDTAVPSRKRGKAG